MAETFAASLDVRPLRPRERHLRLPETFLALAPATAMLLINDHDPKPLHYEFATERPGQFEWSHVESGP